MHSKGSKKRAPEGGRQQAAGAMHRQFSTVHSLHGGGSHGGSNGGSNGDVALLGMQYGASENYGAATTHQGTHGGAAVEAAPEAEEARRTMRQRRSNEGSRQGGAAVTRM